VASCVAVEQISNSTDFLSAATYAALPILYVKSTSNPLYIFIYN
jgi:hypothetical protein